MGRETKEAGSAKSSAAGEKEGKQLLEVVGGVTNGNEDVVAIGGAEETNCRTLKVFKPVAILLHQLEGYEQGGEAFEGGGIEVLDWGERGGGEMQQQLVTIRKHKDGHSSVSRHSPKSLCHLCNIVETWSENWNFCVVWKYHKR